MDPLEILSTTIAVVFEPIPALNGPIDQVFRQVMRTPLNLSQGFRWFNYGI